MARDNGIADRIRRMIADYDLPLDVEEVAGWRTRGSASFDPRGALGHHTASGKGRSAPSLGICTNGRPDLPGPLCQVLRGRFVNGRATVYVIAAGRANHAGAGGWKGLSGNSSVYGLEVENTGTGDEPWTLLDLHVDACILAALIEGCAKPDPELVCEHKEWAPKRKIDRYGINGVDTRRLVAERLARVGAVRAGAPAPDPLAVFVAGLRARAVELLPFVRAFPNLDGSTPYSWHTIRLQQTLNLLILAGVIKGRGYLTEDGLYGDNTIQTVWAYQGTLYGGARDFPGATHDHTRWWLVATLEGMVA